LGSIFNKGVQHMIDVNAMMYIYKINFT